MYNLWTHTNCSDRYCMLSSCVICETVWLKFRITRVSRSKNHVGEDPWKSIRLPYHIWASQQVLSLNVDARRQQLQQAVQVHHKHGSNCRFNLSNSTTFNQNLLIIRYVIYNFNLHISAFFNFHILSHIYIIIYIYFQCFHLRISFLAHGLSFGASTLHRGSIHQADAVAGTCHATDGANFLWIFRFHWRSSRLFPIAYEFIIFPY